VAAGAAAGYAASSPSYYPSPYYCDYPKSLRAAAVTDAIGETHWVAPIGTP
jgi:hypothetical protein